MYVAVKGGEQAIDNAHALLAKKRRGDTGIAELGVEQIRQQLPLAVARVMSEGSLYDEELAALAIKQAAGDLVEAIFLLRAYRTTLPRFAESLPLDTGAMQLSRRISATFKDVPGGQLLGPTFDYTHRLLDFALLAEGERPGPPVDESATLSNCPRVLGLLGEEGLMTPELDRGEPVPDLTREPLELPCSRAERLQALARGDEGFLLALSYSTQRGYGRNHPFAGEIRIGTAEVWIEPQELGFPGLPRRDRADRVRDGQPVRRRERRTGAVHPWLRPGLRLCRAQGDGHGAGRPRAACRRVRRGSAGPSAARGVRPDALRQRRGRRLRLAPEVAALRRLPVRTGADPQAAPAAGRAGQALAETPAKEKRA